MRTTDNIYDNEARLWRAATVAINATAFAIARRLAPSPTSGANATAVDAPTEFLGAVHVPYVMAFWVVVFCAAAIYYASFSPRLLGWIVTAACNRILAKSGSEVRVSSLSASLLGGRVFFSDLRYASRDMAVSALAGVITVRWWRSAVREDLANVGNLPPRLTVELTGARVVLFNKADAYDELERLRASINGSAGAAGRADDDNDSGDDDDDDGDSGNDDCGGEASGAVHFHSFVPPLRSAVQRHNTGGGFSGDAGAAAAAADPPVAAHGARESTASRLVQPVDFSELLPAPAPEPCEIPMLHSRLPHALRPLLYGLVPVADVILASGAIVAIGSPVVPAMLVLSVAAGRVLHLVSPVPSALPPPVPPCSAEMQAVASAATGTGAERTTAAALNAAIETVIQRETNVDADGVTRQKETSAAAVSSTPGPAPSMPRLRSWFVLRAVDITVQLLRNPDWGGQAPVLAAGAAATAAVGSRASFLRRLLPRWLHSAGGNTTRDGRSSGSGLRSAFNGLQGTIAELRAAVNDVVVRPVAETIGGASTAAVPDNNSATLRTIDIAAAPSESGTTPLPTMAAIPRRSRSQMSGDQHKQGNASSDRGDVADAHSKDASELLREVVRRGDLRASNNVSREGAALAPANRAALDRLVMASSRNGGGVFARRSGASLPPVASAAGNERKAVPKLDAHKERVVPRIAGASAWNGLEPFASVKAAQRRSRRRPAGVNVVASSEEDVVDVTAQPRGTSSRTRRRPSNVSAPHGAARVLMLHSLTHGVAPARSLVAADASASGTHDSHLPLRVMSRSNSGTHDDSLAHAPPQPVAGDNAAIVGVAVTSMRTRAGRRSSAGGGNESTVSATASTLDSDTSTSDDASQAPQRRARLVDRALTPLRAFRAAGRRSGEVLARLGRRGTALARRGAERVRKAGRSLGGERSASADVVLTQDATDASMGQSPQLSEVDARRPQDFASKLSKSMASTPLSQQIATSAAAVRARSTPASVRPYGAMVATSGLSGENSAPQQLAPQQQSRLRELVARLAASSRSPSSGAKSSQKRVAGDATFSSPESRRQLDKRITAANSESNSTEATRTTSLPPLQPDTSSALPGRVGTPFDALRFLHTNRGVGRGEPTVLRTHRLTLTYFYDVQLAEATDVAPRSPVTSARSASSNVSDAALVSDGTAPAKLAAQSGDKRAELESVPHQAALPAAAQMGTDSNRASSCPASPLETGVYVVIGAPRTEIVASLLTRRQQRLEALCMALSIPVPEALAAMRSALPHQQRVSWWSASWKVLADVWSDVRLLVSACLAPTSVSTSTSSAARVRADFDSGSAHGAAYTAAETEHLRGLVAELTSYIVHPHAYSTAPPASPLRALRALAEGHIAYVASDTDESSIVGAVAPRVDNDEHTMSQRGVASPAVRSAAQALLGELMPANPETLCAVSPYSTRVVWGPWHHRSYALLYRYFYPPDYRDRRVTHACGVGIDANNSSVPAGMRVFVSLTEPFTLGVPHTLQNRDGGAFDVCTAAAAHRDPGRIGADLVGFYPSTDAYGTGGTWEVATPSATGMLRNTEAQTPNSAPLPTGQTHDAPGGACKPPTLSGEVMQLLTRMTAPPTAFERGLGGAMGALRASGPLSAAAADGLPCGWMTIECGGAMDVEVSSGWGIEAARRYGGGTFSATSVVMLGRVSVSLPGCDEPVLECPEGLLLRTRTAYPRAAAAVIATHTSLVLPTPSLNLLYAHADAVSDLASQFGSASAPSPAEIPWLAPATAAALASAAYHVPSLSTFTVSAAHLTIRLNVNDGNVIDVPWEPLMNAHAVLHVPSAVVASATPYVVAGAMKTTSRFHVALEGQHHASIPTNVLTVTSDANNSGEAWRGE